MKVIQCDICGLEAKHKISIEKYGTSGETIGGFYLKLDICKRCLKKILNRRHILRLKELYDVIKNDK